MRRKHNPQSAVYQNSSWHTHRSVGALGFRITYKVRRVVAAWVSQLHVVANRPEAGESQWPVTDHGCLGSLCCPCCTGDEHCTTRAAKQSTYEALEEEKASSPAGASTGPWAGRSHPPVSTESITPAMTHQLIAPELAKFAPANQGALSSSFQEKGLANRDALQQTTTHIAPCQIESRRVKSWLRGDLTFRPVVGGCLDHCMHSLIFSADCLQRCRGHWLTGACGAVVETTNRKPCLYLRTQKQPETGNRISCDNWDWLTQAQGLNSRCCQGPMPRPVSVLHVLVEANNAPCRTRTLNHTAPIAMAILRRRETSAASTFGATTPLPLRDSHHLPPLAIPWIPIVCCQVQCPSHLPAPVCPPPEPSCPTRERQCQGRPRRAWTESQLQHVVQQECRHC